jgi:hypothetical protein
MIDASSSARTRANAVVVLGVFAVLWFSWGPSDPSSWESALTRIGAIAAVLVTAAGIVQARRTRGEPSVPDARRRFGVIVAAEVASIAAGAAVLAAAGQDDHVPAWVCLVVGVHFAPLDRVFPGIGMRALAAAVICVAAAAFVTGAATSTAPAAVTSLGAGACLLGHAAALLVRGSARPARLGPEPR